MVAPLVSAALVGAGASVLGGIFDRKASKQQSASDRAYTAQRDDSRFQRATKDAKAAGLHPLFALGAGGAGSPSFIAGQSQSGSALGDAVRGAGRVGQAHYKSKIPTRDPLSQELAQLQVENARVTLAGNKLDLIEQQRLLSKNQLVTQSAASSQEIPRLDDQMRTIRPGGQVVPQPGYQKVSILVPGGKRLIIGPSATAEDIELIFGDVAGSVYGVAKAVESAYLTIMDEAKTKNWGSAGTKKTLDSLKKFAARLRMDKSYKRIRKDKLFRARVDSTKSTRKRIPVY